MKKTLFALLLTSLIATTGWAQSEINGTWLSPDGLVIMEIYQEGGASHGKIVWMKNPKDKNGKPHTDRNNPEPALKSRPMMGLHLLEDLKHRNGTWNGSLYSPKRGKTLDAELTLLSKDQLKLTGSFMGFSRDQTWTRTSIPN